MTVILIPDVNWEITGKETSQDGCSTPITTMVGTFISNDGQTYSVTVRHRVNHDEIDKICKKAFDKIIKNIQDIPEGRPFRANVMKTPETVMTQVNDTFVEAAENEKTQVIPFFKAIHDGINGREKEENGSGAGNKNLEKEEQKPLAEGDVQLLINKELPQVPIGSGPLVRQSRPSEIASSTRLKWLPSVATTLTIINTVALGVLILNALMDMRPVSAYRYDGIKPT